MIEVGERVLPQPARQVFPFDICGNDDFWYNGPVSNEVKICRRAKGLSLISGGLDSQLAVCVLREAGADVEGVVFATPFFEPAAARKAAKALDLKLHEIDFTADEIALIENPPHGFGGAMNPCIDCHATMIKRAGELMERLGYDFVATGEVLNQRPMSQNRQSLGVVEKCSGLKGRLLRPLSAQLLEPTIPELEGLFDRSKLLGLSGRQRTPQMELAKRFGLQEYPPPAGGCRLTEKGFGRRLKDLMEHEGLGELRLVRLLVNGRRFRLPGGASAILGRDVADNRILEREAAPGDLLVAPVSVPGPTALVPGGAGEADLDDVCHLVAAYSRFDRFNGEIVVKIVKKGDAEGGGGSREERKIPRPYSRDPFRQYQLL